MYNNIFELDELMKPICLCPADKPIEIEFKFQRTCEAFQ